jgi:hypothetical protein
VNLNITEKNYRKLVLQVALNGFSFCVVDTLNNEVLTFQDIQFNVFQKNSKVEELYWKAFLDHKELTKIYDEVVVIHDNNLNTFVPKALFDEDYLASYLQYNTKVFETDFYTFDTIANQEINNVYVPYVNLNNYLLDQFESFDYKHFSSILLERLLILSKNKEETQVFVHFSADKFEIIVLKNQQLLLFNSFDYTTKEDFIYYLLFTAEQLQLNPEYFNLYLLGAISEESELFEIAYKYVRNVQLLDVSGIQNRNNFTNADNLKHFILFQS